MPTDGRLNVLLTGGSGRVGGILRSAWAGTFNLRLADVRPLGQSTRLDGSEETREMAAAGASLAPTESFVLLDTSDYLQFREACEGIDVVVHLAADPNPGADWETSLLPRNVIGVYNGFEAAKQAGCKRIIFASSVNAVTGYGESTGGRVDASGGGWPRAPHGVPWDAPVNPTNVYGAAKCWGEALGRVYSKQGLSSICVRLGSPEFSQDPDTRECFQYGEPVEDLLAPNVGISPRDTAQLFGKCVSAADELDFAIVNGISDHLVSCLDSRSNRIVGYQAQDVSLHLPPACSTCTVDEHVRVELTEYCFGGPVTYRVRSLHRRQSSDARPLPLFQCWKKGSLDNIYSSAQLYLGDPRY